MAMSITDVRLSGVDLGSLLLLSPRGDIIVGKNRGEYPLVLSVNTVLGMRNWLRSLGDVYYSKTIRAS